jgi:hypothetical protein
MLIPLFVTTVLAIAQSGFSNTQHILNSDKLQMHVSTKQEQENVYWEFEAQLPQEVPNKILTMEFDLQSVGLNSIANPQITIDGQVTQTTIDNNAVEISLDKPTAKIQLVTQSTNLSSHEIALPIKLGLVDNLKTELPNEENPDDGRNTQSLEISPRETKTTNDNLNSNSGVISPNILTRENNNLLSEEESNVVANHSFVSADESSQNAEGDANDADSDESEDNKATPKLIDTNTKKLFDHFNGDNKGNLLSKSYDPKSELVLYDPNKAFDESNQDNDKHYYKAEGTNGNTVTADPTGIKGRLALPTNPQSVTAFTTDFGDAGLAPGDTMENLNFYGASNFEVFTSSDTGINYNDIQITKVRTDKDYIVETTGPDLDKNIPTRDFKANWPAYYYKKFWTPTENSVYEQIGIEFTNYIEGGSNPDFTGKPIHIYLDNIGTYHRSGSAEKEEMGAIITINSVKFSTGTSTVDSFKNPIIVFSSNFYSGVYYNKCDYVDMTIEFVTNDENKKLSEQQYLNIESNLSEESDDKAQSWMTFASLNGKKATNTNNNDPDTGSYPLENNKLFYYSRSLSEGVAWLSGDTHIKTSNLFVNSEPTEINGQNYTRYYGFVAAKKVNGKWNQSEQKIDWWEDDIKDATFYNAAISFAMIGTKHRFALISGTDGVWQNFSSRLAKENEHLVNVDEIGLRIHKTDEAGVNISGNNEQFEIIKEGGEPKSEVTIGGNTFMNLKDEFDIENKGTVGFEETRAPEGYEQDKTQYNLAFEILNPNTSTQTLDIKITDKDGNNISNPLLEWYYVRTLKEGKTDKYMYEINIKFPNKKLPENKNVLFTLEKVDHKGNPLAGAEFTLTKDEDGSTVWPLGNDSDTSFSWDGLEAGDYIVSETKTPTGFKSIEDFKIRVDDEQKLTIIDDPKNVGELKFKEDNLNNHIYTVKVANHPKQMIPKTGGNGIIYYIAIGLIIASSGAYGIAKYNQNKKRR